MKITKDQGDKGRVSFWLVPMLAAAGLLLLGLITPAWGGKGNADNPGVIPPQALPDGKSYGEWGAEWWKWAYAAPASHNPIADPDGRNADWNQKGPVWFLAGTFSQTAVRTITVPVGKKLFFPIVDYFDDYPCPPDFHFEPAPGQTLEQFLTQDVAGYISHVTDMTVTLDGVALKNLWNYRGTSSLTAFTADPSWIAWDPCVTGQPQFGVSDGYWIMLAPLNPGQHTIHFTAAQFFPPDTHYSLDVTYHITVKPPAK